MSVIEPAAPEIVLRGRASTFWTQEKFELAKKLFGEGQSYTQIGLALGLSRNAICGKLTRAKIYRGLRIVPDHEIRNKVRRYKRGIRAAWAGGAADLEPEAAANPVMIADLEDCHCRWPVEGRGAAMLYCGGDAIETSPYCARHSRIAYQAPR